MTPIILVTGFLGSGKTTFINWLLEKHPNTKISIILNEFGNIKLESQFIKQRTESIVELANGCMCCVAKSDIPRVVAYILEHSVQTEFIVIEASGLSDPDPVREALQSPPVSNQTYLESTICIIDAVNFEQNRVEHGIITSQVADADLVLLSKLDEAGAQKVQRSKQILENLIPDVHILDFDSQLSPEIFLTRTQPPVQNIRPSEHSHNHEKYEFYWFESESPMQYEKLQACIHMLPTSVVRIKGIAHCISAAGDPFIIRTQRVGTHQTNEEILDNEDVPTKTTILFIGKEINKGSLGQQLNDARALP